MLIFSCFIFKKMSETSHDHLSSLWWHRLELEKGPIVSPESRHTATEGPRNQNSNSHTNYQDHCFGCAHCKAKYFHIHSSIAFKISKRQVQFVGSGFITGIVIKYRDPCPLLVTQVKPWKANEEPSIVPLWSIYKNTSSTSSTSNIRIQSHLFL